jgi:uncharacterized protein (TIGR02271 family)
MSFYSTAAERRSEPRNRADTSIFGMMSSSGFAWLDMMMNMQREMQKASLSSLSAYSPASDTRLTAQMPTQAAGPTVIAVGEERLHVATQTLQGETIRVRRRVVTQPVEEQVTLRDETVVVERRPALNTGATTGVLTETVVEMSNSQQVPSVWKSVHVAEEVVLRKQVTTRTEKVRETVRHDVVDIDHLRGAKPLDRSNDAVGRAAADVVGAAAREAMELGRDMSLAAMSEAMRGPRRETTPDIGQRQQSLADHDAKVAQPTFDKDKVEAEKKALGLTPIVPSKKS